MEFEFEETYGADASIPPEFTGLYSQTEEGFTRVEGSDGIVAAFKGTRKSLNESRSKLKAANTESAGRRTELKGFSELASELGIDLGDDDAAVDAFRTFATDLNSKIKNGEEVNVNMGKIKADSERRIADNDAVNEQKLAGMKNSLSKYLVDGAAHAALASAKGAAALLLPQVQRQCRVVQEGDDFVVRVVDAQGDARSNSSGGFMGVAELVAEMKGNKDYARAFESDTPAGSGTPPGGMRKPVHTNHQDRSEMSATQKISAGLNKRQSR